MPEPLQSNLELLTKEQRKTMAAMLRRIASNEKLSKADRDNATARADELDPPKHPGIPPSPLFDPQD
jgi:hypothetical protein